ncbi:MAG: PAS domain S-box protein, partial [Firmicutes bacterium]|nr:PAS domain S-box protein [Bacillota bacterium]
MKQLHDLASASARAKSVPDNKYLAIFESLPQPVMVLDKKQKIDSINQAGLRMFKISKGDGLPPWLAEGVNSSVVSKEPVSEFLAKVNGEKDALYFNVKISRALENSGQHEGIILIFNDITEHKQAEDCAKYACEELNQIVNYTIDGIRVVDMNFNIIRVTESFIELSGMSRDQAVGKKCYEVFPGSLCHTPNCPLLRVRNGEERVKCDVEKVCKNGEKIPCNVTATPFWTAKGRKIGIVENFRDITERKRVEDELRNSHQKLLNIIEFLPDATFVIDKDKKVIAWNRAIEQMTGKRKEEIIGKGDYLYAVPFYGEQRPILIDLVISRDEQVEKQYDFVRQRGITLFTEFFVPSLFDGKGAYLWGNASPLYDADGNLVGAIESIRDITEQKEAEKALRLSEERFAKAFNGNPIPMTISTLDNGCLLDVNESFIQTTGYSRQEVIGCTTTNLSIWLDSKDRAQFMQMLREQGTVRNWESTFKIKSGEARVGLFSSDLIELNGTKYIVHLHIITYTIMVCFFIIKQPNLFIPPQQNAKILANCLGGFLL